jgi:hypothetical protein
MAISAIREALTMSRMLLYVAVRTTSGLRRLSCSCKHVQILSSCTGILTWFWLERSGLATHARSQARSEQEYQHRVQVDPNSGDFCIEPNIGIAFAGPARFSTSSRYRPTSMCSRCMPYLRSWSSPSSRVLLHWVSRCSYLPCSAGLRYGKGDMILSVFVIVTRCSAPRALWVYGKKIRKVSRHARA